MSQIGQYPNAFYRVSLKAVIRNEVGHVLLVKEKNNAKNWNLPGGGMDHGESPHDALKRELYEEVGYRGDFTMKPIGIEPMYVMAHDACMLWVVYEVNCGSNNFAAGPEADEISFIDTTTFAESDNRAEQLIYKFTVDNSYVPLDLFSKY